MATTTYQVLGMTCDHCVRSVRTEVGGIDGVRDVRVDLASGQLTVTDDGRVTPGQIRDAVAEAGYDLREQS